MYYVVEYFNNGRPPEGEKPARSVISKVLLQSTSEEEVVKVAEDYLQGLRRISHNKYAIHQIRACDSY